MQNNPSEDDKIPSKTFIPEKALLVAEDEPVPESNPDTSAIPKNDEQIPVTELWNKVGFHKSLAGFYFSIMFTFISLAISLIFAKTLH